MDGVREGSIIGQQPAQTDQVLPDTIPVPETTQPTNFTPLSQLEPFNPSLLNRGDLSDIGSLHEEPVTDPIETQDVPKDTKEKNTSIPQEIESGYRPNTQEMATMAQLIQSFQQVEDTPLSPADVQDMVPEIEEGSFFSKIIDRIVAFFSRLFKRRE